jgi:hypothetical protein
VCICGDAHPGSLRGRNIGGRRYARLRSASRNLALLRTGHQYRNGQVNGNTKVNPKVNGNTKVNPKVNGNTKVNPKVNGTTQTAATPHSRRRFTNRPTLYTYPQTLVQ